MILDNFLKQIQIRIEQAILEKKNEKARTYILGLLDSAARNVFNRDEVSAVLDCLIACIDSTRETTSDLVEMAKNIANFYKLDQQRETIIFYNGESQFVVSNGANEDGVNMRLSLLHAALRCAKGSQINRMINKINLLEIEEVYRILNQPIQQRIIKAVGDDNSDDLIDSLEAMKLLSEKSLSSNYKEAVLCKLLFEIKASIKDKMVFVIGVLSDRPVLTQADKMLLLWLSKLMSADSNNDNAKQVKDNACLKPCWLDYSKELSVLRSRWSRSAPDHIVFQQKQFNLSMRGLINKIAQDVCDLLPPPEPFCLALYGSLARMEMTPYSDLEFSLLVSSENHIDYFERWFALFNWRITCLGEGSLSDKCKLKGFHIDTGINRDSELIVATPDSLEVAFRNSCMNNACPRYPAEDRVYSHVFSSPLFSNNAGSDLWSAYRTKTADLLLESRSEKEKLYRELGKKYLRRHLTDFSSLAGELFDAKDQLYSPIIYFISDLALYFNVDSPTMSDNQAEPATLTLLAALRNANYINSTLYEVLEKAYRLATCVRVNALQRAKGQTKPETVFFYSADSATCMTEEESFWVRQINNGILKFLPSIVDRLCEHDDATLLFGFEPKEILYYKQACDPHLSKDNAPTDSCYIDMVLAHFYLTDSLSDLNQHLEFFSQIAKNDESRNYYISQLETFIQGEPYANNLIEILNVYPNRQKIRPGFDLKIESWNKKITAMGVPNDAIRTVYSKTREHAWLTWSGFGQNTHTIFLDSAIVKQIFEDDGSGNIQKNSNLKGQRNVIPVFLDGHKTPHAYWKFYPEHAGMQIFSMVIAHQITGFGMQCVLGRLKYRNTDNNTAIIYPVLISEPKGLTLDLHSSNDEKDGRRILHNVSSALDSRKFTLKVLETMVMAYEDGHAGNITAKPIVVDEKGTLSYELCDIDSDHALLPLTRKEGRFRKKEALNHRSIAYCFPQMNESINLEAMKEFLSLDIHSIVLLAKGLTFKYEHAAVESLFSREQIVQYYEGEGFGQRRNERCLIPTEISSTGLTNVYLHFQAIRQRLLSDHKDRSLLELLEAVVPIAAAPCKRVLEMEDIDPKQRYRLLSLQPSSECLKNNNNQSTRSTTAQIVSESLGKSAFKTNVMYLKTQTIHEKFNRIQKYIDEIIVPKYYNFIGFLGYVDEIERGEIDHFAEIISNDRNDGARIQQVVNAVNFKRMSNNIKDEEKLRQALIILLNLMYPYHQYTILRLSNCKYLNDRNFRQIIKNSPHLRQLLLENVNLGKSSLKAINEYCPKLRYQYFLRDDLPGLYMLDAEGNNALHRAAKKGQLDILNYRINLGDSLSIKNKLGEDLLIIAARHNQHRVITYLQQFGLAQSQPYLITWNNHALDSWWFQKIDSHRVIDHLESARLLQEIDDEEKETYINALKFQDRIAPLIDCPFYLSIFMTVVKKFPQLQMNPLMTRKHFYDYYVKDRLFELLYQSNDTKQTIKDFFNTLEWLSFKTFSEGQIDIFIQQSNKYNDDFQKDQIRRLSSKNSTLCSLKNITFKTLSKDAVEEFYVINSRNWIGEGQSFLKKIPNIQSVPGALIVPNSMSNYEFVSRSFLFYFLNRVLYSSLLNHSFEVSLQYWGSTLFFLDPNVDILLGFLIEEFREERQMTQAKVRLYELVSCSRSRNQLTLQEEEKLSRMVAASNAFMLLNGLGCSFRFKTDVEPDFFDGLCLHMKLMEKLRKNFTNVFLGKKYTSWVDLTHRTSVSVSNDGLWVAATIGDSIQVWAIDGMPSAVFSLPDKPKFTCVIFSPDGDYLAASDTSKVIVWNRFTGKVTHLFEYPSAASLAFSCSGQYLAARFIGKIIVWNMDSKKSQIIEPGSREDGELSLHGHALIVLYGLGPLRFLQGENQHKLLFIYGTDSVRLSDIHTGQTQILRDGLGGARLVDLSPDNKGFIVTSGTVYNFKKIYYFDFKEGLIFSIVTNRSFIFSLVFSRNGQWFASAAEQDKNVILWNKKGEKIASLSHDDPVKNVIVSKNDHIITHTGKSVSLWVNKENSVEKIWERGLHGNLLNRQLSW